VSRSSRALSDKDRAMLIGSALEDIKRARHRLQVAGLHATEARMAPIAGEILRAYQDLSGRQQHEVRCLHGTLLSRPCMACEVQSRVRHNVYR